MSGSAARNPLLASVGVAAILIVIIAAFASVPVTQAVTYPTTTVVTSPQAFVVVKVTNLTQVLVGPSTTSSVSYYQTSTPSLATTTVQTTTSQGIFNIGSTMVLPDMYVVSSASLQGASSIRVTWSTNNPANVYVFNSTEYAHYTQSSTTHPNIKSKTNVGSGSFSFVTSLQDTYYLVIANPNKGFFGIGAKIDFVNSSGLETYNTQTAIQVTRTNTFTATTTLYSTVTTTSTSTTSVLDTFTETTTQYATQTVQATTTKSCSLSLWQWATGNRTCT